MTKHIFRVPVDTKNFVDTIERGKQYTEILPFLTFTEKAHLEKVAQGGILRYWGSIPGESNQKVFLSIAEGDELLCYRSGKYVALATIAFSTVNPVLARYSWGEKAKKQTWELMYFFKEVTLLSVDLRVINSAFGYKNSPVMGFSKLSDQNASQFISTYGSVASFLNQL
jgi:hypothetical protein